MKRTLRLNWLWVVMILGMVLVWGCPSSSPGPGVVTPVEEDGSGDDEMPIGNDPLVVQTPSGSLRGTENDLARIYRGIPFAAPPVGELRWKAPEEAIAWSGELDATASRNVCTQSEMDTTWHSSGKIIGSEDCLYLDIYRPKNADVQLPVYVYFHGGANRFGGATSYDGSYLAEDQNVIVIIAQYRLGPLGWLRHAALRSGLEKDADSDSGNFGLLDNIKALEWVNQNIVHFGGDPAQVTIGGQSAGASNVAKLLISPLAKGLFKGAVLQSFGGSILTPAAGEGLAQAMLAKLPGYSAIDPANLDAVQSFLRSKTAVELITAHGTTYSGFADGTVLPGNYVDTIFSGKYNSVPIMIGTTEYEWKNFMPLYAAYPPSYGGYNRPLWANVYDLFDPNFDPNRQWTFADIFPTQADVDLYEAIGKVRSIGWKSKSVDELATLLQERQDGVYAYQFKWGGTQSASAEYAHVFGAAHGMDIPFFFGYDRDLFRYALTDANRPGFEALQGIMMAYLGNFIRSGNPGTAGATQWVEWSNATSADAPKCMILDADTQTARIGMDATRVMPGDLSAIAQAEVDGWTDAASIAMVTGIGTSYPPEYILNDDAHELLISSLVFTPLTGAKAVWGVHQGAGYRIEIPQGWKPGVNDLVMYAHGYRSPATYGNDLGVTTPSGLRDYLIANQIAWAASSYTANDYNIVTGVESTQALLDHFKTTIGEPARAYLAGHSMGGHITARTVADSPYAANYDGALPMCGVVGGGNALFSYQMDWGLAASYYASLEADVPYSTDEADAYRTAIFDTAGDGIGELGRYPTELNPAGDLFKTAMMYRSGGDRPLFDRAWLQWASFMTNYAVNRYLPNPYLTTLPELGPFSGNASTVYHLDSEYASASADEIDLNNGIERVADPVESNFDALMLPVSGNINIPVLSLHTLGDLYVPFSMEQIWAEKIAGAGRGNYFRARAIRGINHCNFTVEEQVEAFKDLVEWVSNGVVPGGDDITNAAVVDDDDFGCAYTIQGTGRSYTTDDPDYYTVCGVTP